MKHALVLIFALVLGIPVFAGETYEPDINMEMAAHIFDETRKAADRENGQLWNVKLYGPILLVEPETRQVVANQADLEGRLKPTGPVFTGTLPAGVLTANTSVEWAGVRWAMVLWPLPDDAVARTALLIHETFHRLQPELGFESANPANAHLETLDGRYLLRLEWRALGAALTARGAGRVRAIEDALAFRAHRRKLFPEAIPEENALELNEGIAEYTACVTAYRTPKARAAELLGSGERKPSFTRSFAYASGPAYGILLDAFDKNWRQRLGRGSDLGDLLAKASRARPPAEAATSVSLRAARYGGPELLAAERDRATASHARGERYRTRFIDGPVLRIRLVNVNISFNPNTIEPFADMGTVYPTAELSDAWGTLRISGGALLSPDWSAVTVPAPIDPAVRPLAGDGWTLELAPGWELVSGPRPGDKRIEKVRIAEDPPRY